MNAPSMHILPLTVIVKQTQQKTKDMTLASLKDKRYFQVIVELSKLKIFKKEKKKKSYHTPGNLIISPGRIFKKQVIARVLLMHSDCKLGAT